MRIIAVGINHQNTPLEIREQLNLSTTQQELLLSELKSWPSVAEAFVLSTCNRVEVYAHVIDSCDGGTPSLFQSGASRRVDETDTVSSLIRLIFRIKKIRSPDVLIPYFYAYRDKEAVGHLLRVVAGLDSMILGEEQILGQVKEAFARSHEQGMLARHFHVLGNVAIRTGKKVRQETPIGIGGSSVSWAAITKAEQELGHLRDKSILVVGAGKMSDVAVGHISNRGFGNLYLMNRTPANAENLARKYGGVAVSFCDMKEVLSQVDICICSVGAPHYILEKDVVQKALPGRGDRPLTLIDISLPRNIDPSAAQLPGVRLYQLDDLKKVVDSNMEERRKAIPHVEGIIRRKLSEFFEKVQKDTSRNPDDCPSDFRLITDVSWE